MGTSKKSGNLLVVDDEPDLRTLYEITLQRCGYTVTTAGDVDTARELLQAHTYDVLVTDMRLPDGMGIELIEWLQSKQRSERAIVITAYGSADNAVRALKAGAFDYLTKPINLDQFRSVVNQAVSAVVPVPQQEDAHEDAPKSVATTETPAPKATSTPQAAIKTESTNHKKPAKIQADAAVPEVADTSDDPMAHMIGSGAQMQQLKTTLRKVAPSMAPVLVLGESGSGKELVARALHQCSHRAKGAFVAVNCGAIPENLLEAEFFGAKKGAYTGSVADREGLFQAAGGGTLFLDEIGDLPLSMQAKLLRVIQERLVRPLGASKEISVDVRIVSATHKSLVNMVQEGLFRQDLYYRLNVIEVQVPPLRERREDIASIAHALLAKITAQDADATPSMTPAFLQKLQTLPLPGNVRELENTLHRCWALSDGSTLDIDLLQDEIATAPTFSDNAGAASNLAAQSGSMSVMQHIDSVDLPCDLVEFLNVQERALLIKALHQTEFNRTAAGTLLGLNLRQMRYRMERLNIVEPSEPTSPDIA